MEDIKEAVISHVELNHPLTILCTTHLKPIQALGPCPRSTSNSEFQLSLTLSATTNTHPVVHFKTIFLPMALAALSTLVSGSPVVSTNALALRQTGWKSTIATGPVAARSIPADAPADAIIVARDAQAHSLEKRVFTSPHMKRAFRVAISGTISAVNWVIDFTLKQEPSSQVTINYKLQSSLGLNSPDVDISSLTRITESANQFRGNAKIKLIGTYAGKVVHIFFNGEVFGSDAAMIWQSMISEPEAYINGVKTKIDSWTFEEVK